MSTTQGGLCRANGVKEKKKKHPDSDLAALRACLRITPTPEHRIPPIPGVPGHEIPLIPEHRIPSVLELAPESCYKIAPIPNHPGKTTQSSPPSPQQDTLYKLSMFGLLLLLTLEAVTFLDISFPINFLKEVCCAV